MPVLKKFLKSSFVQAVAAFLLSAFIRLVYLTSRKERRIDAKAKRYAEGHDNAIFAFWHGRMMLLPAFYPSRRKMRVLISKHRDGSLISQVIGHFGLATVSGSSSKGGKEAASEILRALENGDNIGITPDGPRGPSQVATRGVVTLARLSKRPVVPVMFASTREQRMNSWDRFALALPFGRIILCVGEPIIVPEGISDADEEAYRKQVETAMNRLVDTAESAARA